MQAKFPGKLLPYIFLLPTIIICGLFIYYPAAMTFRTSMYQSLFFGARQRFVGIQNFTRLLTSPNYLRSMGITLWFVFLVVAIGLSLSLLIAVLLNRKLHAAKALRVALVWPYALSPAVAGTIWLFLFNPHSGLVNYLLDLLFSNKPDWFSHPTLALTMLIVTSIWNNFGYNLVFFLAGLQNISDSFMEAAEVDGASFWRQLFHVTIPLLSPTIFFLLVININYAFFDTVGMVDVMTKGGPANATNMLIYQLYKDGFQNFNSGLAAAQSLILFVFVVGLTLLQFRTTGRMVHYGS
ncbi:MAG TPA: sugar ABC transporter permease [Limnochordia bacterium]|jgi:sn-glycerol 3-phosphate transport system permease protein|nr:MAG: glycerol-3-phosphate ABC transporter permease [Peptococcaceae bacterium 1109]HOK32761.1 sugar ABC transporter permease [Limnochordia bacterium]